ncbi:aminotransferase [Actinorhabdospora filicis]|uniref:Aminotransferase n=1 Tax=Actinorhabdospora filicis TaxID=1785913 RepID=A0A9W6WAC9_9ACTN|nr:pyridoxal phosphate-dependent aminotransferase [Actinorhabdospora filicis]GLZ77510.1 aminotransferase [Actinorhabdospora filicis]
MTGPRIAARARAIPLGLGKSLHATPGPGSIDLSIGLPGYPEPPAELVEAAIGRLRSGDHQYEETAGSPGARALIAASYDVPTDPDTEVTITNGATEALTAALLTFCEPGDEVIVFEPFYTNFLSAIALSGARPRFVRLHAPDWTYDPAELAAAFTPATRAIIVNTPNNPTGHVFTPAELTEIARHCRERDIPLLADEVYAHYVHEGRWTSVTGIEEARDLCVAIGSLSKSHAVSGWRIGHIRAPAPLTAAIRRVHEAITGSTAAPLQNALVLAGLTPSTWDQAALMRSLRDRALTAFQTLGLKTFTPAGGCYFLADAPDASGFACAERLYADHGIIIAPGELFYAEPPETARIRVAFNKSPELIEKLVERVAQG